MGLRQGELFLAFHLLDPLFEGDAEVVGGEGIFFAGEELVEGAGGVEGFGAALGAVPGVELDFDFDPGLGGVGAVAGHLEAPGVIKEAGDVGGHGVVGDLIAGKVLEEEVDALLVGGRGGGEGIDDDDDQGGQEHEDESDEEPAAVGAGGGGGFWRRGGRG